MKINKVIEFILFTFILALALFPRSIEVLNGNYIFGFDQGRDYLAVKNIVVDHKLTLIGSEVGAGAAGLNGIFQGPIYYYFLSVPFILTKGDPYGGIVLMFILSSISVVFSYFLGKKIFGAIGGLVAALLFALSPMFIAQARFTWNSNPSTLFILLTFFFTYLGIKKKSKYIFLSSFFAAFIYNFQFAVSIPLSLSVILFYIFIVKLRDIRKYIILFLGFFFGFLPMLIFEIRHGFMGIKGFATYLFGSKEIGSSSLPSQRIIVDHINSFFNAFIDVFPKDIVSPHLLLVIVLVPAFFHLYKEKNTALRKFITFLFLLFPVYFLVFLFFRNAIWVYYLIALNIVYILLFSYSVASSFKNNLVMKIFYLGLLLFITFKTLPIFAAMFSYDYKDYGGTAKMVGKIDAIDFVYDDAKGEKFSMFVFSPPIYTYPYDYILWWHAKDKYGYVPENVKKGMIYLLIEKDNDQIWRHKGWLETVIGEGNTIWEKELPSGFMVQKRLMQ